MTHPLVTALRKGLADAADPLRAPTMQRYMKSEMPFRGVPAPLGARIERAAIAAHPLPDRATWEGVVRELYDDARYREERYAALAVLSDRRHARWLDSAALPLLDHLVRTGAWWDLVDEASTAVGRALANDRRRVTADLRRWAHDPDLWIRRAAIICQRSQRAATDTALLADAIDASVADPDFFARKGIGWALREYSKTDAAWVRDFVAARPGLSPLSRREALKWLAASERRSGGA